MKFLKRFRFSTGSNDKKNHPKQKSRRLFFKIIGLGAGVSATKVYAGNTADFGSELEKAAGFFADKIDLILYRPQDLLELEMSFVGFKKGADGKSIIKSGSPNFLIVQFQPQSIAEQAFEESSGFENQAASVPGEKIKAFGANVTLPAKTYIAGKSRLVFEVPANINAVNLTAKDLLDWTKFKLVTNKRAAVNPDFTAQDNVPDYENIIIKLGDIKPAAPSGRPAKIENVPPPVNQQREQQKNINQVPVRIITNGVDTVKQVQLNKILRGATKDEQKIIAAKEAPQEAVRVNNDIGLMGTITNLFYGKTPRPVDATETAIEMPYRLFISPNEYAVWHHEYELKSRIDLNTSTVKTFELWHSRLFSKDCDDKKDLTDATKCLKTIRALWGVDVTGKYKDEEAVKRDYSPDGSKNDGTDLQNKFVTSLYNDDRQKIVHESSNWAIPNFKPQPANVNNLMLSTLGAWLDAEMLVPRKDLEKASVLGTLNLLKWKHIATMARDHYVEVVTAGNILPFGHEASLVRITERKPQNNYAVNRQRFFIVITEEEKKYNPYNMEMNPPTFKSFPFSTVKFITTATPTLDTPIQKFCSEIEGQGDWQFIPKVSNKDFIFKMMAFDLEGNEVDFEMPLVFVSTNVSYSNGGGYNLSNIDKLHKCYNTNENLTKVNFRSQQMALTRSQVKGDTNFQVQSIKFNSHGTLHDAPGFRPECVELEVFINAVQQITGKNEANKIKLIDDKNKGTVFAELVNASAVNFNGSGNKTGGSLAPNFSITALSKLHGAIGGNIKDAMNLDFKPAKFFDDTAKLFGVIKLSDIIGDAANAAAIPALKTIETAGAGITQYIWNGASLKSAKVKLVEFVPKSAAAGKLVVETNLYRYKDAAKQSLLTVNSYIDDFAIKIAGVAQVQFNRVGFSTGSNAKVDVTVDLDKNLPLKFLGALSFVNDLQKFIPADGFSDPPYLDVSTSGVVTGYTLALPDLQLGAFTLRHVSLGAEVNLPFTGNPLSLRLAFCERQQPFTLTVGILGGGGFFAVKFNVNGLQSLEAALEFGAAASINLGVASGAVSIMGGIYFKVQGDNIELEGYVRINGALSVLGLITASVEFLMALTAFIAKDAQGEDKVTKVVGKAQVKIKIELFMFSKTVTLETSREFAGAGADPTFAMMISNKDWEEYCSAFAA